MRGGGGNRWRWQRNRKTGNGGGSKPQFEVESRNAICALSENAICALSEETKADTRTRKSEEETKGPYPAIEVFLFVDAGRTCSGLRH